MAGVSKAIATSAVRRGTTSKVFIKVGAEAGSEGYRLSSMGMRLERAMNHRIHGGEIVSLNV